jgi:hypothetical protein
VVVWRDDEGDGSSGGVFAQRYAIAGGVVTALGGQQPDGTQASGNFRVNAIEFDWQYAARVTDLADGGFVVTYNSDSADGSGRGVRAQIYNADGTRRGGELLVNSSSRNNQGGDDDANDPNATGGPAEAIGLSDGSFVVVWQSEHNDGATSYDIYAKRFAANGAVLDEEVRVNTTGDGLQHQPVVTWLADGFVAAWTSHGQDGSSAGVFSQRFLLDRGPGAGEAALRPSLTVSESVTADEDTDIPLTISASLADTDGSETLRLTISEIPVGARLTDGTRSFVATAQNDTADITGWTLATLRITPRADDASDFTLKVRAVATETSSGDIAVNTDEIRVTVIDLPEPQAPFMAEFRVNGTIAGQQGQPKVTALANGDTLITWYSDGSQPGGSSWDVMGRFFNADGTPKGAEFIINTPAAGQQNDAEAVQLGDGTILVTWTDGDASNWGVWAQRFTSDGVRLGRNGGTTDTGRFLINSEQQHSNQWGGATTALADGGWITVWDSLDNEAAAPGTWGVFAKRFDAAGVVVPMFEDAAGDAKAVVRVTATTAGSQTLPSVVQLANGALVFSWVSSDRGPANPNQDPNNPSDDFLPINDFDANPGSHHENGDGVWARVWGVDGRPATGEFLVNQEPDDIQTVGTGTDAGTPMRALTPLADGGFVAVWQSHGQDGSSWGVFARKFNADGTPATNGFQVNSAAWDSQQEPHVAALPDGGFLIAWTSHGQDGSSWGVYAQRYAANTERVGTEFRLNVTTGGDQSSPSFAVQADGSGIVFAWEDQDGGGQGVMGKRIPLPDALLEQAIARDGPERRVNVTTANNQHEPVVAKLSDGTYVVVWKSDGQEGFTAGIYARRYEADGDPIQLTDAQGVLLTTSGGAPLYEMRVNLVGPNDKGDAHVEGLPGGGFVVVYESYHQAGGSGADIYARKFTNDMQPVNLFQADGTGTPELRLNSHVPNGQHHATIGVHADGSFTVVWHSHFQDGDSWGIYGRTVDATGRMAPGDDVRINSTTSDQQHSADIAVLAGGDYVVVWQSHGHDGSSWGAYGQRFNADGSRDGDEFLINTHTDVQQEEVRVAALTGGGYVVVWSTLTSMDGDGSGWGIAGQRFDAAGAPVAPSSRSTAWRCTASTTRR